MFSLTFNCASERVDALRNTIRQTRTRSGTLKHQFLLPMVPTLTVSKQLGHANVATTEGFYSHIIEGNLNKASECIADVMLRRDKAK